MRPNIIELLKKNIEEKPTSEQRQQQVDESIVQENQLGPQSEQEIQQPQPKPETPKPQTELPKDRQATEEEMNRVADNRMAMEMDASSFKAGQVAEESAPGTWTPEYTQMGFVEKTGQSLLRGFGKHVVGGTGDMIQMLNLAVPGWEVAEGNMLSRMLQEKGEAMAERHQIYLPEEIRDPEFNLKTFMNPDFWSGHIAEYIPQLVEFIFLSKGASAGAKGLARYGASKVGKQTAKRIGKEALENTTEQIAKGSARKTVQELGGKGLGKLITKKGEASQLALQLSEITGGGVSMNILSGALNAGQLVNEMKEYKDADGNSLYTDDELKQMATGTMINNLQYLPIDMLSWGMVYAKDSRFLNGIGSNFKKAIRSGKNSNLSGARKFYSKTDQLKYGGKSFIQGNRPIMKAVERSANRLGKPIFEGYEETFQETWEEWAQKKAVADVTGKPMKYDDYFDFYFSKENEATRAISFALGGLGGAGASIMQTINQKAEDQYKLWDRAENLKRRAEAGNREAEMMQQWHVSDQMISNKLDNTNITNQEWLQTLLDDGILTEEEFEEQLALAEEIDTDFEQAKSMNIRGKMAFLQNKQKKLFYERGLQEQEEILKNKIANYRATITDNPKLLDSKIREAGEEYNTLKTALETELALATENIMNLVSGKEANPSYTTFVKDENGKTVAVGLTKQQYEDFYNQTDEEVFEAARRATLDKGKSFIQKLSDTAKGIFKGISDKFKARAEEKENAKKQEALAQAEEVGVLSEDTIQDAPDQISLGDQSIDVSAIKNLPVEEQPEAIKKANEQIEAYNKSVSEAKAKSEEKEKSETKSEPKENVVPDSIRKILDDSYSSDDTENNVKKGLASVDRWLAKQDDIDLNNKEEAKKELLKRAKSGNAKVKKLLKGMEKKQDELAEFLYNQLAGTTESETQETEETVEKKDGTLDVVKGVKKVYKKAKEKAQEVKEKITIAEKLQRAKAAHVNRANQQMRNRIYSPDYNSNPVTKNELDAYLTSAIGKVTYGPTAINKAIHLNSHLKNLYPGQGVRVYAMTNLFDSIGIDALGYSVLSSILIDEKVWEQDEIYMHEFAHLNYKLTKDQPFMQEFIKKAVYTNKPLLTQVMNTYKDLILYEDLDTGAIIRQGDVDPDTFKVNLATKAYKMLPITQQADILEEAYVATMQGPLSKEFNKYFDQKKEPLRQLLVKRVWGHIKGRARQFENNEIDVVKALNNGENIPVGNIKNYIMEKFVENIQGKDVTARGMAMKELQKDAKEQAEENAIAVRWLKAVNNNNLDEQIKESINTLESRVAPDDYDQDPEIYKTTADDLIVNKYDKTFERHDERMGGIFQNFFEKYYKKLKAEHDARTENKDVFFESPFVDHLIKETYMNMAKEADNAFEFINKLEKSNDPHIIEFMNYLEDIYEKDDHLSILRSSHMLYSNAEVVPGMFHQLSSNGTYRAVTAFSSAEENMLENIRDRELNEELSDQVQDDLASGNITDETINRLIRLFTNSSINARAIIDGGYMYVDGRLLPLKEAVNEFMKQGLFQEVSEGVIDFKTDIDKFIKALINTNRQYSSFSVVKGPRGTNTSSRIIGNALTKLTKEMRDDLLEGKMTKNQFINKYSVDVSQRSKAIAEIRSNDKNKGVGKQILSPLLSAYYDTFQDTGELPALLQDLGNQNHINNTSKDYKDSTANEQLINETLLFFDYAAKGKPTYPASLDVFGDSSRRYLVTVPAHTAVFKDGKLTTEGRNLMKAAYQTYVAMLDDSSQVEGFKPVSYNTFEKSALKDISKFVKYFKDNSKDFSKINMLTTQLGYINENGNLTKSGQHGVETFMFNRIVNSLFLHQTLNPGIPINSIQKRNKGNISPVIAISKDLKFEMLFVTDETIPGTNIKRNDGGQFILEEDAKLLEQAGMGVIDLNKGFKMFSHGVERDNPKFKNKVHQMKGYTSILSKKMVTGNGTQTRLKPYYDLLVERRQKFINWYEEEYGIKYNPVFGTDSGKPKYMGIITPISAEKATLLNNKQLEDLAQFATLDALEQNKEEYIKILDGFHYEKKRKARVRNGNSKMEVVDDFNGFNGSNFGPQQVMDKEYLFTTFSIQAISSIIVGATGTDLDNAMEIQELISEQKAELLEQNVLKHIESPFDEDLTKFILRTTNQDKADPYNVSAMKDGAPPYAPHIRQFTTNQMRKQFIREGNKLLLPGTYAQTIGDYGFQRKVTEGKYKGAIEYINGSSGINFYSYMKDRTLPMEVILPKSESKTGVRLRQKFYGDNVREVVKERIKAKHMKEFNLTEETLDDFVEAHKIHIKENGKLKNIGYFIPGEYVMMTRIPHNGPVFMAVAEAIAFNESGASNIVVSSEYKNMIGSDDDGDALFVYKHVKNKYGDPHIKYKAWNKAFDGLKKQWLSPRMKEMLTTPLDFEEETNRVIAEIKSDLNIAEEDFIIPYGSESYKESFNNSVIAKQTIGIAFNSHRILNTVAAFGAKTTNQKKQPISIEIGSTKYNDISDFGSGERSRIHQSTKVTNILLDSTKNNHAAALKLNTDTVGPAMILANMGFNIKSIGLLFNHPAALDYINRFADVKNNYIDTGSRAEILRDIHQDYKNIDFDRFNFNDISVIVSKRGQEKAYESQENKVQIVQLMNYLFHVNNDVSLLSNLMSGHKKLESNPHALQKQIQDYEKVISNEMEGQVLQFSDEFADSPEIQSYLDVSRKWLETSKRLSMVFNPIVDNVLTKIAESLTSEELNDQQLAHFSEKIRPFIYSRLIGMNNQPEAKLKELFYGETSAVEGVKNHMRMLNNIITFEDPTNPDMNLTALDGSRLFREAIELTMEPNGEMDITIVPEWLTNKAFSDENWNQVRNEFANLPSDLQLKLVYYDLIKHGWDGPKSIYPVFSKGIHDYINNQSKEFQKKANDETEKLRNSVLQELFDNIVNIEMQEDRNHFPKLYLNNQETPNFDVDVIAAKIKAKYGFRQKLRKRIPFYAQVFSVDKQGNFDKVNSVFIKVNPVAEEVVEEVQDDQLFSRGARSRARRSQHATTARKYSQNIAEQIEIIEQKDIKKELDGVPKEIGIVTVKDIENKSDLEVKKNDNNEQPKPLKNTGKRGMAYRTDFNNFTGKEFLTYDQYNDAMQYKHPVSRERKIELYDKYMRDKGAANRMQPLHFTPEKIRAMSDEKLLENYQKFGERDIYAYSNILVPIMLELVDRGSIEQSKLTKRYEDGKDIGFVQSYLQSNNIASNHPATQATQRYLEKGFKSFIDERKKYVRKINKATEELYQEKFGIKPTGNKFFNKLRLAFLALIKDRKKIYEKLYGNIIKEEQKYDENRGYIKRYTLKSDAVLLAELKKGKISQAEYNFAKTFRETVNELGQYAKKSDYYTNGYVPAVAMSRLEAFSHRGLLGMLANSKSEDIAVQDVMMEFEGEKMSFKQIEDIYKHEMGNNIKNVKDYIVLKRKAHKLLKEGINEDGTPIHNSRITNLTLLGDGMMNKFANDGYKDIDEMLSMDLNKALNDFVHTSLFVNGNGVFEGFTKLQAQVDGLLLHNKMKGFDNQNKFVRKVYKEYFLKGQRLNKATTTDNVIDALVKGNLLYIMGWKLLVLGKGAYVVGNAIVGKYHNIKNAGGKTWLQGEKRFWSVTNKSFKNRKGVGVLNTLNFMDINLYDEVNIQKSSGLDSIFTEIIFMPMQYSEKWIQGVHMLGLLTEEQWNKFDENGNYKEGVEPISNQELIEMENKVKNAHGKGYTPTDQRLIQQYSWGKAMMQFARFIPTMFYDRFAKKDVNIYGKEHMGSLRLVGDVIQKMLSGQISPKEFADYRNSLTPDMRNRLDSGLRGLAFTSLAMFVGQNFNIDTANELTGDANYLVNTEKLEYKMMPSTVRTLHDVSSHFIP